jgi:hypothetical protein
MDYFLKFPDQETAAAVLGADEDGNILYATDQRIAEALFGDGIVRLVTVEGEGEEAVYTSTPQDGYHVNVRALGDFEIDAQYVVIPTQPRCVFS